MKKSLFIILVLIALLALKSSTGYQVLSTNTSVVKVNVSAVWPQVSNVFVEDSPTNAPPDEIDLVGGGVKLVICNGTVYDANGAQDIVKVNATFWDMGSTSQDCAADYNTMYINDSCQIDPYNSTTVIATCYFWVRYNANPTIDSNYPWTCNLWAWDSYGLSDVGSDNTSMNSLLAIGSQPLLQFGIKYAAVNDTYLTTNHTSSNYGNILFDMAMNGTPMSCEVGSIPVGYLKYNCTKYNASYASEGAELTSSLTSVHCTEFDLDKSFTSSGTVVPTSKLSYWGIGIPPGVKGNCQGTIWFGAVQNPLNWHADINMGSQDIDDDDTSRIDYSTSSKVYVLWHNTGKGLLFRSSSDDGASWSTVTSPNDTSASSPSDQRMASNGNTVHVVWLDLRDPLAQVYYSNSTDGGATWNTPNQRLSVTDGEADKPDIAAVGNNVYVVWDTNLYDDPATSAVETNIRFRKSTDAGATWGSIKNLTTPTTNISDSFTKIVAVGNLIHVVFQRQNSTSNELQLYYMNSSDGGANWNSPINITPPEDVSGFEIAANSNTVYVAYSLSPTGPLKLLRGANNGTSWSSTTLQSGAIDPDIDVEGQNITIAFENPTQHTVRIIESKDGGTSWTLNGHIVGLHGCAQSSTGVEPAVAINGPQIHISWTDNRYYTAYFREVYYKAFR